MYTKTLFIGAILFLGSVFFVGCTEYIPEDQRLLVVPDVIESIDLMKDIQESTQIAFSKIEPDALIWNFLKEEKIGSVGLDGYMYKVRGAEVNAENINSYFEEKGFELDVYNVADGVYIGQVGFKREGLVCTVVSGINPEVKDSVTGAMLSDITVRCAELKK
jgi:hypothetical protein